jgi:hypothetical protein
VADQEKRIREMENALLSCPIQRVVEDQEKLKKDTENMRALSRIMKGSSLMALVAIIGLLLRIFGVI